MGKRMSKNIQFDILSLCLQSTVSKLIRVLSGLTPQWSLWLLMLLLSLMHTPNHNGFLVSSVSVVLSFRTMFHLTALLWQSLKTKSLWSVFFYSWTIRMRRTCFPWMRSMLFVLTDTFQIWIIELPQFSPQFTWCKGYIKIPRIFGTLSASI